MERDSDIACSIAISGTRRLFTVSQKSGTCKPMKVVIIPSAQLTMLESTIGLH